MNELEQVAYSEKKIEKNPWLPDERPTAPKVPSCTVFCRYINTVPTCYFFSLSEIVTVPTYLIINTV